MQFGLGKQQSTERRVGSQFALWQTLRHNQQLSRSLPILYLAHSIRRGAIGKHCQIGQKCHKNIFGWQLQEESPSTTNCWGCLCLCWWCCCWVNVDIDVDVDFGHETPTQMQRQSQTGNRNAVRELWPHKIRQSMSQNGQIAELLLLLPQLQCGTN